MIIYVTGVTYMICYKYDSTWPSLTQTENLTSNLVKVSIDYKYFITICLLISSGAMTFFKIKD